MKLKEAKNDLSKKIIAQGGKIEGLGAFVLSHNAKHPTYKTMDMEHVAYFNKFNKVDANK